MSFTTNIAGNAPANTFVYTTTTVSVDNISVENLSATNASITRLTTQIFSPVNVTATNIECTDLTVLDAGNFSEIYTSYIHTSNMSLDGTLGGHTANFVTINSDNCITDALYLNEQSAVLTDKSLVKRDANQVNFIGKNSSTDVTGADFLFRTGLETDVVKLTIPRTSDIVGVIALEADTTITAPTGNFSTANCDSCNTDALYINEQSAVLTDKSLIKRDANQIMFIGKSDATDVTGADFLFRTGLETNAVKLTIPRSSDVIGMIALDVDTTISSTLISTNTINASNVNSSAMTTVSLNTTSMFAQGAIIGATVDADILEALYEFHITDKTTGTSNQTIIHRFSNYFEMYNTNVVAPYKIYTGTNTGTPDLEITSSGIVADISPNLAAGTGIQLATVAGVTTITNTGIVTDPLNVSQLNASNISCVNLSASNDITALEVRGTAIVSSPILEGGFVDTLTGDITNLSSNNISLSNATLATSLTGPGIINTTGIIQTTGAINGGTINGNIANNLAAGTGINLNTVGGITTISNTGGSVTDPLNLSKLNASNISCDNISAELITGDIFSTLSAGGGVTISQNTPSAGITQISATALSTSTQYAFKAYSTSGDAYSINGAVTIPYNSLSPQTGFDGYSIPNTSSYNTAQATYTIPVSGYWYIGYTLRQRSTSTTSGLVAIYRNGSAYMINGNYTGNQEGMSITLYADAGDLFYVRSQSGSFSVDMRPTAAMFFGFLLQPENNTVTATTNLSIQNLSVSNDITALEVRGTAIVSSPILEGGFVDTLTGDITNLSSTNISLTNATLATSLTGAGNINITGDIQTTGVINGATLTGDIGGNLAAGTGIQLATVTGVTTITNLSPYQLPISRVFAARTTALQQPNPSGNNYYTDYNQIDQTSSHVNYVAVPISTGATNTGAIIQTAGTYKITFTQQVYNNSYPNRVSWWSRATKNNTVTGAQTFIYTRSDQTQWAQYGSNSVTWIETCAVNDYLQVWSVVAKNSPLYNNNWSGLRGGIGSMLVIELLT